ncbi:MAG: hypothetical protein WKG07_00675 [Hymenobacter sp.]
MADAYVQGGTGKDANFSSEARIAVKKGSTANVPRYGYRKFDASFPDPEQKWARRRSRFSATSRKRRRRKLRLRPTPPPIIGTRPPSLSPMRPP